MASQLDPAPLRKNVAVPSEVVLNGLKSTDQKTVLLPLVPQATRSPLLARSARDLQAVPVSGLLVLVEKTVVKVLTNEGSIGSMKTRLTEVPGDPQPCRGAGGSGAAAPTPLVTSRTGLILSV